MGTTLLVPAAGTGQRFGAAKQLHHLHGRPLFWWSIVPFCDLVDEIVIACPESMWPIAEDALAACCGASGQPSLKLVAGGAQRQDSVHAALVASDPQADRILVHDAARPLITSTVIGRVLAALDTHPAALAALPCRDTVKRGTDDHLVVETVPRDHLWLAQTPQAFHRQAGLAAFAAAAADAWYGTDDVAVLARAGHAVALVEGDVNNFKVTTPADAKLAARLLAPA